jgi:hypothetical protein
MEQGQGVLPSLDMGVQLDREVDGPGMTIREPAEVSLSTGQPDLPSLGDVREGNYPALAAQAEAAGDPELSAQIMRIGEQMSSQDMELAETSSVVKFTDSNGEERTTYAKQDRLSGRFLNSSTGRFIPRDAVVKVQSTEQLTAISREITRASSKLEPLSETRVALLDTMSSAERLNELAYRSPGVLTTVGNLGPQLLTRLRSEFNAINNLYLSGATDREIYAAINERAGRRNCRCVPRRRTFQRRGASVRL